MSIVGGQVLEVKTYVIEHIVGLPMSHIGGCPPLIHSAGNYGIELDGRRTPGRCAMRRSIFRCSGNRGVHLSLGSMARLPPFSPITNHWSDMWIVHELMG